MDFEKLYNAFYMQVYSYLMTLSGNPHTAEEITQEVFFKAMKTQFIRRTDLAVRHCQKHLYRRMQKAGQVSER